MLITVSNSLKKDPRVVKQIDLCKKCGYDIFFLGYNDAFTDYKYLDNLNINYTLVSLPIKYQGRLNNIFKKIMRSIYINRTIGGIIIKEKPDLIHANDFDMLVPSYLAARNNKIPIVYDSHEIWVENNEFNNKHLYKFIMRFVEKRIIKKVSRVITVSNASARFLSEKYDIDLPLVITNCPLNADISNTKNIGFEILYHGMISESRGYEEFIESALHVNNEITLVVRGYGKLKDNLITKVKNMNACKHIRFDEPVEVDRLVYEASKSHIGIVLTKPVNINYKMTISNKIFEYIHAGLPVIMSDLPEHNFLNDKFNFGIIVNPNSVEEISNAINKLYNDAELYNILLMGVKKMQLEYNWETQSNYLKELYREILNE